jgi:hypothetical protein
VGEGGLERGGDPEIPDEVLHVAEVLVPLAAGDQPRPHRIDAGPAQRRFGEQDRPCSSSVAVTNAVNPEMSASTSSPSSV